MALMGMQSWSHRCLGTSSQCLSWIQDIFGWDVGSGHSDASIKAPGVASDALKVKSELQEAIETKEFTSTARASPKAALGGSWRVIFRAHRELITFGQASSWRRCTPGGPRTPGPSRRRCGRQAGEVRLRAEGTLKEPCEVYPSKEVCFS